MNKNADFFYYIFLFSFLYIFIRTRTKGMENKDWNCNQWESNHLTSLLMFNIKGLFKSVLA